MFLCTSHNGWFMLQCAMQLLHLLLILRHQHKIHLLHGLVEANFTDMQQLTANWSTPRTVCKLEGMSYTRNSNKNKTIF